MPNTLHTQIQAFAAQFAADVLKAIRSASLDDILSESTAHRAAAPSPVAAAGAGPVKRGRGRPKGSKNVAPAAKAAAPAAAGSPAKRGRGRPKGSKDSAPRKKRTGAVSVIESITSYIRQHPGTSGEAARKALKIERTSWSPTIAKAIAEKKVRKEGQRRSTKYWAT